MARVPDDEKRNLVVPVWPEYEKIVNLAEGQEVYCMFGAIYKGWGFEVRCVLQPLTLPSDPRAVCSLF